MILFIGKAIKTISKTIAECRGPRSAGRQTVAPMLRATRCVQKVYEAFRISKCEQQLLEERKLAMEAGETWAGGGARAGAVGDCIVCDPEGERIHLWPVD